MKNLNFLLKKRMYFLIFFFALTPIIFESCTREQNSFTSEASNVNIRNDENSINTYDSIANLMKSIVEIYNETFDVDGLYLSRIDENVTVDIVILENELGMTLTSQEHLKVQEINQNIQILIDLLDSVLEDGLSVGELEEVSWLWLQIIYPNIDFENLASNDSLEPNCPCKRKYSRCNLLAYGIYAGGLVACGGSSVICPPCAAACAIANGLVLVNNMDNCDFKYKYCLRENGGC